MPHLVKRDVKAQEIYKGDQLDAPELPGVPRIVEDRNWKTKWVYLTYKGQDRQHRFAVDSVVTVWRSEPTDEEKRARNIERAALSIRGKADDAFGRQHAYRAKLAERLTSNYRPADYNDVSTLIEVDAAAWLWRGFVNRVRHDCEIDKDRERDDLDVLNDVENVDLVETARGFRQYYVDQFIEGETGRGLSRSTSVISNAIEDAERQALGRFMRDLHWAGLDYIGE